MKVTDQIKKMRAQSGLSQEKLAYAVGVSFNTIRNWEKGACEPSISQFRKIRELSQTNKTQSSAQ